MAKIKKAYFCTECGCESAKWVGKCSSCGAWNTMVEEVISKEKPSAFVPAERSVPVAVTRIKPLTEARIVLDNGEVNRVLGGGIVPGSLILLGGEPGIGKSTLSLQLALKAKNIKTLYVSGEESPQQIKIRAERLGSDNETCFIYAETLLENILNQINALEPDLVVVDSIQTMFTDSIESSPGSVSQIRECASLLLKYAKQSGVPVILIGHITKDGVIAGPKILEHIVDVVLQFEGDGNNIYRILRGIKNRFGATSEIGVFEMRNEGLKEVANPSDILLSEHYGEALSGIAIGASIDGIRPYLIETQALVSTAAYGTPQRTSTGFEHKRLNMLLAVLEKRLNFKMYSNDVFLNFAGGFKINDPGMDMAVIASVLSSALDRPISGKTCFAGEIGLSGEIRPASRTDNRIAEAERHGFKRIIVSGYSHLDKKVKTGRKIEIIEVNRIDELLRTLFRDKSYDNEI
ncbi:MAG: DNA repair protein RadA [Rikenellaceae bacterium]|nr:DNA repair protein RadA [Rikenellaceae bacterium]